MRFETSTIDNRAAPPGSIWRPSGHADAPTGPRRPVVWNPFDMAGQRLFSPVTAAILRALALPADTVIRTAARPPTDMVAIEVVIYRTLAAAIAGDTRAAALIADRIEGRPGLRSDAVDPDEPARRQRVQAVIESVVRHMVERAASAPAMGADGSLAANPR